MLSRTNVGAKHITDRAQLQVNGVRWVGLAPGKLPVACLFPHHLHSMLSSQSFALFMENTHSTKRITWHAGMAYLFFSHILPTLVRTFIHLTVNGMFSPGKCQRNCRESFPEF